MLFEEICSPPGPPSISYQLLLGTHIPPKFLLEIWGKDLNIFFSPGQLDNTIHFSQCASICTKYQELQNDVKVVLYSLSTKALLDISSGTTQKFYLSTNNF